VLDGLFTELSIIVHGRVAKFSQHERASQNKR
jgi:hypothetical protein